MFTTGPGLRGSGATVQSQASYCSEGALNSYESRTYRRGLHGGGGGPGSLPAGPGLQEPEEQHGPLPQEGRCRQAGEQTPAPAGQAGLGQPDGELLPVSSS